MGVIKARGIVINERETGEADKNLTLFLKGQGKAFAHARGARKPKSKIMAATQLFAYSDFILYSGNNFLSVASAEVIEIFYDLRCDYDRLMTGNFLLEICDKTIQENLANDDILLLLLKSLLRLSKGGHNLVIETAFLFKFFAFCGMTPEMAGCVSCGAMPETAFFFGAQGLLCPSCAPGNVSVRLSVPSIQAISRILSAESGQLFTCPANNAVLTEMRRAAGLFLRVNF